jgi:uncharacterized membrane protein
MFVVSSTFLSKYYICSIPLYNSTQCTLCPENHYASEKGSLICSACPSGTFSSEIGSTSCSECPLGTWTSQNGRSCDLKSFLVNNANAVYFSGIVFGLQPIPNMFFVYD